MLRLIRRLVTTARNLGRQAALERDLDEELQGACDLLTERYVAAGMEPGKARRAARLALEGVEPVKEEVRARRAGAAIESTLLDVRYAWRTLWKAPVFATVVVLTLALGIGANTAMFSVVHALLLAPLPYHDSDRLVFVWSDMTSEGYPRAPLSGPELQDLRERSTTCAQFGAIWSNTTALTGEGDPEQLRIGLVTDDFFRVLGAEPAIGRSFMPEDARPGAHPTILLGWPVFERRFGGDRAIVGRQILVNDRPTTVIGVMPRAFRLLLPRDSSVPDDLQAWQPFGSGMVRGPRGQQFLRVVGRMKAGVTLAEAQADISQIARRISREFTEYGASGRVFLTVGLQADDVREMRPALLALFAGVGILLTIACVNVASLLIARAAARREEIALRLAIGAGRGRLLRQCLVDGVLLAVLGGSAGVLTAAGMLRGLAAARPEALSRIELSRLDSPVLLFTLGLSLLWGVFFSFAPLLEVFGADAAPVLRRQDRGTGGQVRYRTRASLVTVQVALSVVLLVGAGLLVRSFVRLLSVDPGFHPDHALTFRVAVPFQRYRPPAAFTAFSLQLQQKLRAIPGVIGVGAISHVPYDDLPNWGGGYVKEDAADRTNVPNADYRTVTPGLFEALDVHPIAGRLFTADDRDGRHPVAIVDDKLAQRLWPNGDVLGRHLMVDPASTGTATQKVEIVGVVRHLKLRSLIDDLTEQVFFPQALVLRNPMAYVVRTQGDGAALAADVRHAIAALDPRLPIYDVRPLDSYVADARAASRFTMWLAAGFAVVALLLACIGVFGVLAYSVARRRREFGVRLALGAEPRRVVGLVMKEGLRLTMYGGAAGLGASLITSPLLSAQLYAVDAHDPPTYTVSVVVIALAAAVACWIPARRATRVSPMDALRAE